VSRGAVALGLRRGWQTGLHIRGVGREAGGISIDRAILGGVGIGVSMGTEACPRGEPIGAEGWGSGAGQ